MKNTRQAATAGERHFACPVHGAIACTALEARIVDTPVFQRLRRIKQLGNTALVFPGATHTRFAHSLGVMHLAGQLFDSLIPEARGAPAHVREARDALRARVRLAGLLHDIGHGPYSHHFENLLVTWHEGKPVPLRYEDWEAPELRTPTSWLRKETEKAFGRDALAHEHYTYGLVRVLAGVFGAQDGASQNAETLDAQGVCALLDERIAPSASLGNDLATLALALAGEAGQERADTLLKCLKSILSSDIDADRMDYLQRDSLSCGVRVALDLRHLFASARIEWAGTLSRFVLLVKPNAVGVIEQILIARKQMFDQVYQHRVTVAFDSLLTEAMHYWMRTHAISPPTTLRGFLALTDDALDSALLALVGDTRVRGETRERLALKMFVTRTAPVREEERVVPASQVEQVKSDLRALAVSRAAACGTRTPGKHDILDVSLKEFFKTNRETLDSNGDVLFVAQSAGANADAGALPPTPLRHYSELLQSTAWRNSRVRVVLYSPREQSALARGLEEKLVFIVPPDLPDPHLGAGKEKAQPKTKPTQVRTVRAKRKAQQAPGKPARPAQRA